MQRRIVLLISTVALFSVVVLPQRVDPGTTPVMERMRDLGVIPPRRAVTNDASENFVVGDVRGTVRTKPGYLAKPVYPDEARLAGVEGTVRVQISINEEGSVTKAEAVEGDLNLRAVAEDAARRSKFRIPRDTGGQAVNDQGVLVYSFEIRKAGWSWIAYRLSGLDKIPVSTFPIPPALKSLPAEWTDERKLFEKLDEIRRSEPDLPKRPTVVRSQTTGPVRLPNGMMAQSSSIRGTFALPAIRPEQVAVSRDLITALTSRLANDKLSSWQFELGLQLHNSFGLSRNPADRTNSADRIRGFIENRPEGVSLEVVTALKELETNFRQDVISKETIEVDRKSMSLILRSK